MNPLIKLACWLKENNCFKEARQVNKMLKHSSLTDFSFAVTFEATELWKQIVLKNPSRLVKYYSNEKIDNLVQGIIDAYSLHSLRNLPTGEALKIIEEENQKGNLWGGSNTPNVVGKKMYEISEELRGKLKSSSIRAGILQSMPDEEFLEPLFLKFEEHLELAKKWKQEEEEECGYSEPLENYFLSGSSGKDLYNDEKFQQAFLTWKAGGNKEVDWRPTETLPEDYYTI